MHWDWFGLGSSFLDGLVAAPSSRTPSIGLVLTILAGESTSQSKITFSGLLNAIDGVISSDGTILFMTTNHLKRRDPVFGPSGPLRSQCILRQCHPDQARRMFTHFSPDQHGG